MKRAICYYHVTVQSLRDSVCHLSVPCDAGRSDLRYGCTPSTSAVGSAPDGSAGSVVHGTDCCTYQLQCHCMDLAFHRFHRGMMKRQMTCGMLMMMTHMAGRVVRFYSVEYD